MAGADEKAKAIVTAAAKSTLSIFTGF